MNRMNIFNTYLSCWLQLFYCSSKEALLMEKAKQETISADRINICLQHTEKKQHAVQKHSPLVGYSQRT
jgi:hypothetical protein